MALALLAIDCAASCNLLFLNCDMQVAEASVVAAFSMFLTGEVASVTEAVKDAAAKVNRILNKDAVSAIVGNIADQKACSRCNLSPALILRTAAGREVVVEVRLHLYSIKAKIQLMFGFAGPRFFLCSLL